MPETLIPQAILPEVMPVARALRAAQQMQNAELDWQAPLNITLAAGVAQLAFDNVSTIKRKSLAKVTVQNNSAAVIFWAINSTPTANSYHGILAAGSAAEDGLGSILTLQGFKGKLYIFSVAGGKTSVTIGYTNV